MRLRSLLPQLPPELQLYIHLLALPPLKVAQSHPLLFTSTRELYDLLVQIPEEAWPVTSRGYELSMRQIDRLKLEVARLESPAFLKGDQLLEEHQTRQEWELGVGIEEVDALLQGLGRDGRGGGIIEISGGQGSGKTVRLHSRDPSSLELKLASLLLSLGIRPPS